MYLDTAKKRYEELYRFGYSTPLPCTEEEVEALESWVGHRLPKAYREFLLWMGHSGGGFLRGSDFLYKDLKYMQRSAKELLAENHFPGVLPKDAFVVFMHQGYQFNFFRFGEGDDPPVYFYIEDIPPRTSFTQIYPKLSDFLLTEIDGHIRVEEEMTQRKKKHQE